MDYTIFYVLGAGALIVGVVVLVNYLKNKGLISASDLIKVAKFLDIAEDVVIDLGLDKDGKISNIVDLVEESLNEIILVLGTTDKDAIIEAAYNFAVSKCTDLGLKLNDTRKNLLRKLITIAVDNVYYDKIVG